MDEKISPVSPLDNFLIHNNFKDYNIKFYNIFTGNELKNQQDIDNLYEELLNNSNNSCYTTTDHLIYGIEIDSVQFLYVSLDNSVRSNINNFSLFHKRLHKLMDVVSVILKQSPNTIVFFSESCRPSFIGGISERKCEVSWLDIRNVIKSTTNMELITEARNNDDNSGLSFGISVWSMPCVQESIKIYYTKRILEEGFGSTAVEIKNKQTCLGCSFTTRF